MILKKLLDEFENTSRFCKIVYSENEGNKGIGYTLNKGVLMCSNEIILKMDSDDIMVPERAIKQVEFMKTHPEIAICGAQIQMFHEMLDLDISTIYSFEEEQNYSIESNFQDILEDVQAFDLSQDDMSALIIFIKFINDNPHNTSTLIEEFQSVIDDDLDKFVSTYY